MTDVPDPDRQRLDPVVDPGAGDYPAEPGDSEPVHGGVDLDATTSGGWTVTLTKTA